MTMTLDQDRETRVRTARIYFALIAGTFVLAIPGRCAASTKNSVAGETIVLVQPIHEYGLSFEAEIRRDNKSGKVPNLFRFNTHLGTNYGLLGPATHQLKWANGQVVIGLHKPARGRWAGMWHSLAGLAEEKEVSLDFSRCYPVFILDDYQPKCVGVRLRAKGCGAVKLEIKTSDNRILWRGVRQLTDWEATADYDFALAPDSVKDAKFLSWSVEYPANVTIDAVSLLLKFPQLPIEKRIFLICYAKLSRCYSPQHGIVKDRANWRGGELDCVPTSGMFCLATCAAWHLGIVERDFAAEALYKVHKTISALRRGRGLLPHFIQNRNVSMILRHLPVEFSVALFR